MLFKFFLVLTRIRLGSAKTWSFFFLLWELRQVSRTFECNPRVLYPPPRYSHPTSLFTLPLGRCREMLGSLCKNWEELAGSVATPQRAAFRGTNPSVCCVLRQVPSLSGLRITSWCMGWSWGVRLVSWVSGRDEGRFHCIQGWL